jgi:SAM-dependent methyltransferase
MTGNLVVRDEPCRGCNETTGAQVGMVDYWDLKTSKIVACGRCGLIQLDPMLTEEETARGCFAYYIEESLRTGKEEQFKNCERNFRKGVLFGYYLKRRNFSPQRVLELGPGSGYFAAGLQFVFPAVSISVMDINSDILQFNSEHHNFQPIHEFPDNLSKGLKNTFDLIIARDILEHLADISSVVENISQYLCPGGLFHFITPNGHEDVWKHYLTLKLENVPSELLINHVNYFDGKGLKQLLTGNGFRAVEYYTCKFKTTFRGRGWKKSRKLMNPVSKKQCAGFFIERAAELEKTEYIKADILNKWYIRPGAKWITILYSFYHHHSIFRVSPEHRFGDEIYGLFIKSV